MDRSRRYEAPEGRTRETSDSPNRERQQELYSNHQEDTQIRHAWEAQDVTKSRQLAIEELIDTLANDRKTTKNEGVSRPTSEHSIQSEYFNNFPLTGKEQEYGYKYIDRVHRDEYKESHETTQQAKEKRDDLKEMLDSYRNSNIYSASNSDSE